MNTLFMRTVDMTRLPQIVRFILSGASNVLLTFGVFWLLLDVFGMYYVLASFLTWLVGITVNFSLMWFWVFREDDLKNALQTYQRHFVFHAAYYAFNLMLLVVFTELTKANPLIVQAVLLVFLLPINFFATKYFVMKNGLSDLQKAD